MDALNFVTALRGLVKEELSEIHTSIPVRVTGVDYDAKTVTLESIIKNTRSTDDEIDYPTFHDVPFMVNGGGTGRISFPIKAGDIGTVIFSERDPSNALQTAGDSPSSSTLIQPCGLYPICFIPKIATATDSTEAVDPNNVVISNNKKTYGSFDPDGTISLYNSQGVKIDLTPEGLFVQTSGQPIKVTDGTGTFQISGGALSWVGGSANFNGLVIDENGEMTDGNGVGFHNHTHLVKNIQTGDGERESEKPTGE